MCLCQVQNRLDCDFFGPTSENVREWGSAPMLDEFEARFSGDGGPEEGYEFDDLFNEIDGEFFFDGLVNHSTDRLGFNIHGCGNLLTKQLRKGEKEVVTFMHFQTLPSTLALSFVTRVVKSLAGGL